MRWPPFVGSTPPVATPRLSTPRTTTLPSAGHDAFRQRSVSKYSQCRRSCYVPPCASSISGLPSRIMLTRLGVRR